MQNWGRRIRAALGMGLAWAVAGIVLGGVLARLPGPKTDLPLPLLFGPLGFFCGIIFSAVLVVVGGGRGLDRMSMSRFAVWGGVSGLLLTGIFVAGAAFRGDSMWGEFLVFGPALAIASAACAAGSLGLAKRAERRELGSPNIIPAVAELLAHEKREVLRRRD
ncbi:MAG TPA: hypothetical protein VM099_08525 [Gemmatimonadaceae bacterium]|nr:hypothetical protein [Gemmatimonadaceae bacterium]